MYLKTHKRKKNGKYHEYYSIAEKRKISRGRYVEKIVLYLGEISDSQKKSWQKSIEILNEDNKPIYKSLFAIDNETQACYDVDTIPIKLSKMKLSKPRTFGDCWLGCEIWDQLGLDKFWSERIDTTRSPLNYSKVLKLLTVNRLIKPGSEFYIHHHWFDQTAMAALLDCDYEVASKDRRSDCRQVLVALVVTPDGFPINYEVLVGNIAEKTTLTGLIDKIENMYGKARRVWLMDRGIPTEQSLAVMRETGIDYLVGTPRKLLDEFQNKLIDKEWQQVNESVRVKHLENNGECFVLACSKSRMAKERAIRKRKLRKYLDGLAKLKKNYRDRDRFMKRLGVLQSEAGSCRHCIDLKLPAQGKRVTYFDFSFNRKKYQQMIYRDGMYFLRTNQIGKEAVELWQQYMLQCNVEQAFKDMKSDLGIRPVYHHKEDRVDAHIFVAFLSYCLQTTLRHKLRQSASGLTAQAVLETLCRIQMLDVTFETQDNRILLMQRYTEPELEHKLILSHLRMELPLQKPPKIYNNEVGT